MKHIPYFHFPNFSWYDNQAFYTGIASQERTNKDCKQARSSFKGQQLCDIVW